MGGEPVKRIVESEGIEEKEEGEVEEEEEEEVLLLAFCCEDRENKNKKHQKQRGSAPLDAKPRVHGSSDVGVSCHWLCT